MQVERVYRQRLLASLVAYVVLLVISLTLLKQTENPAARVLLSLLPVLPVAFGVLAFTRFLRGIDELQRRIQLEGLGFSVAITGLLTFTLGMLENAGLPSVSMTWVFPALVIFWGIGVALAGRRYQ